jgi:hypothetical protein
VDTEVEFRLIEEGRGRTRVELEHRGLERYGDAAPMLHAIFDSPEGWAGTLRALSVEAAVP